MPGLDGLRGIALLMVVFFHLNLLGFGWIGVQLFFVLSGFLITRSLLALRQRPAGDALRVFYARRTLRIFPAYYLYLALALIACALLPASTGVEATQRQAPWALAYLYNWHAMAPGHAASPFLDHTWSLSIEEQFYLAWPALALLLPVARLRPALIALLVAGPLLRLAVWALLPMAPLTELAYRVAICTVSQLDAFAAGALLCFLPEWLQRLRRPGLVLAGAAIALLLAGIAVNGPGVLPDRRFGLPLVLGWPNTLPAYFQFAWGYSAINLAAALLVGLAAFRGFGAQLLEQRWLRAVGRVSYGAYLLHYPLAHLSRPALAAIHEATGFSPYATVLAWTPVYLALLFALASASYYGFERAFLRMKPG